MTKQFYAASKSEQGQLYYTFSYEESNNMAFCREGYRDAVAMLEHFKNAGPILEKVLEKVKLERLEAHGPRAELDKAREAFAELDTIWFETDGKGLRNF